MPWLADNLMDDEGKETLRSAGCGFTLNLPEGWSVRLDMGWPLTGKMPMDGKHYHQWLRVTKTF